MPGTDEVRDSPAIDLEATLESDGATVRFCDPIVRSFKDAFGGVVEVSADAYKALAGADAVIVVTEWEEFRQLGWADAARAMGTPYVFDGRNVLDPRVMWACGIVLVKWGCRHRPWRVWWGEDGSR